MEMGRDGDARQVEREFHRVEVRDALQPAFFFGARRYVSSRREVHRCTAGVRLRTRYLGERDTEQTSASGSAPGAALCLCPPPWTTYSWAPRCSLWVSCWCPEVPHLGARLGVPGAKSPLITTRGPPTLARVEHAALCTVVTEVTHSTSLLGGILGGVTGHFPTNNGHR
ncbi:hypothetical protein BGZ61DRAFT_54210 [Ilyonectria robusta]|uniref:uncharacterized protein n=1 Tax=Ilyonectria robusta TaxID=1079257 RepID=UPI001E8DB0D1|nr:uncharacterized protein BGZ61DRAFT_54210 [Ilyonectria robusta]KAH8686602.1 hypothetical protein BGZ61DRAFT_54210 [Ilyonectria robusta]